MPFLLIFIYKFIVIPIKISQDFSWYRHVYSKILYGVICKTDKIILTKNEGGAFPFRLKYIITWQLYSMYNVGPQKIQINNNVGKQIM